jgi:hypothetical protein
MEEGLFYMAEFIVKYWIEFLFGLIAAGLTATVRYLLSQNKRRTTEQEAIKLGIQALLRDRIIEQYNKWMEKEYIPIYALENVTAMYKQYHALGGNGTITHLYEELLELPSWKG